MENNKIDNPPTFPTGIYNDEGEFARFDHGMSLRDYFAAKAMQGIVNTFDSNGISTFPDYPEIAESAYGIADAMLKARHGS